MATKKKFIDVELPIINEAMPVLGEAETLTGKTIKLDLSRKLKGRGLEVVFQIMNKDGKLVAHPKNLTLMRSYVQRMMRKRVNYVEDSFVGSCKDVAVTIKPFLITRKKVSRAIRNNLRKTAKEFVLEYVKTKTYMELAKEIIFGEMQKQMYPRLKKVYPLSLCEIRVLETKDLSKADLTIAVKEETKEEVVELTQAEEIEAEQKKKAEEIEKEEKKEKKSKKKSEEKEE